MRFLSFSKNLDMQFSENVNESNHLTDLNTRIKATIAFAVRSIAPVAISLIFTRQADAFEPWRNGQSQFAFGIGGIGEARPDDASHQSITEDAIKAFARDSLSFRPSEAAIKEIVTANGYTDKWEVFSSSAHFDDEDFSGGQKRLAQKIADIIASLNAGKISKAREALGQALHAVQDFYSHSNWVETRAGIYEDLGRGGPLTVASGPTCLDCPDDSGCENNLILPVQWTSGYFSAVFSKKPTGKCSHGGSKDRTSGAHPLGGINKDTSNSPHGALHHSAAAAAVLASKRFLANLQTDHHVTVEQLRKLLGGPTLVISIDTTAGMRPIIEDVKNSAIRIVNNRLGTDEEPGEYVLAPFNDPGVPDPIVTSDPNVFKRAISSLSASGGGDSPEFAMTGAFKALSAASSSGDLFLFTDDNAKDASRETAVRDLAANKKIRVFPSVFPSTNNPKSGRHTPSAAATTVSDEVDPSYQEVAEGTAGQLFSLDTSEAGQIMTLLDDVSRSNAVNLLSIQDTLGPTPSVYQIPIDNTLSAVTFSVSGDTSVMLTGPDGIVVQADDPGVTMVSLSSAHLFSIASPPTGFWQISVSGSGAFSVTVTGEATLDVKSFDFVQDPTSQAHELGLFPIDGFPVALQTNIVSGELTDAFDFAQFEFRSPSGGILQVLGLQQGTGTASTVFVGRVIPPSTPFLVYATGRTAAGVPFQRLLPGAITPQSVTIEAPAPADLVPGTLTTYTFRVHNLGSADRFNFTAFDDKDFLGGITPASFRLNEDETKEVTVTLRTPPRVVIGTSDTLIVNVTTSRPKHTERVPPEQEKKDRSNLFKTRNFAVVVSDVAEPSALNLPRHSRSDQRPDVNN
jgi:von Willebrand factor A domain-containing protein 7